MATILIVEDDANARLLTEANLKRFYNTLTAANGREALSVIYDKHVDLILVGHHDARDGRLRNGEGPAGRGERSAHYLYDGKAIHGG